MIGATLRGDQERDKIERPTADSDASKGKTLPEIDRPIVAQRMPDKAMIFHGIR
jgi:hypothetical protein